MRPVCGRYTARATYCSAGVVAGAQVNTTHTGDYCAHCGVLRRIAMYCDVLRGILPSANIRTPYSMSILLVRANPNSRKQAELSALPFSTCHCNLYQNNYISIISTMSTFFSICFVFFFDRFRHAAPAPVLPYSRIRILKYAANRIRSFTSGFKPEKACFAKKRKKR